MSGRVFIAERGPMAPYLDASLRAAGLETVVVFGEEDQDHPRLDEVLVQVRVHHGAHRREDVTFLHAHWWLASCFPVKAVPSQYGRGPRFASSR